MSDGFAIPVLSILKIMTPSDISTLSKQVSGTEKIELTKLLTEDSGFSKKESSKGPWKSGPQKKEKETGQENQVNQAVQETQEKSLSASAKHGGGNPQLRKKKVKKNNTEKHNAEKKKARSDDSEGPSSTNFFIEEKEKMKTTEVGIKKIEILKLYKLSLAVDIQKGKNEDDLAKTGQTGILFNKRRF